MKNFSKIAISVLFIIIGICFFNFTFAANLKVDVNFNGEKIKMTSDTPDMTWNINNLLPGESDKTELIISNTGSKKVDVKFNATIENGHDLAEVLNFKVFKVASNANEEDEKVFEGKYSNFKNLEVSLESGKTQSYRIETSLPMEIGNEFQNKECTVKLNFNATGIENEKPKVETDVVEPQTGESYAVYVIFGVLVLAVVGLVLTFFKKRD